MLQCFTKTGPECLITNGLPAFCVEIAFCGKMLLRSSPSTALLLHVMQASHCGTVDPFQFHKRTLFAICLYLRANYGQGSHPYKLTRTVTQVSI